MKHIESKGLGLVWNLQNSGFCPIKWMHRIHSTQPRSSWMVLEWRLKSLLNQRTPLRYGGALVQGLENHQCNQGRCSASTQEEHYFQIQAPPAQYTSKRCLTKQLNLGTKVHIHIYWYVHVRTEIDLKTQFVGKFFWRSKMALLVPLSSASQRWTATKRAFELHQSLTGLALESLNDWNAETICFCTQVTMWKLYAEKKGSHNEWTFKTHHKHSVRFFEYKPVACIMYLDRKNIEGN